MIDENLNWKSHVSFIEGKIKRAIGMLSKLRHFVTKSILVSLYYSLIYPYFIYGIVVWGNTYHHTINPLFILQKKAVRIMTFADFKEHTNPIFIDLKILKFHDLVWLQTAIFMHDFHHGNLPVVFNQFFLLVNKRHDYNTRSASKLNYSLPYVRTNYGKFNIKFVGAKVWNSLDEDLKNLNKTPFKKQLSKSIINLYIN